MWSLFGMWKILKRRKSGKVLKVHHAGKMGDLVYALPVMRALAREYGPIHLITSGHCWQMVPLLWEQPYFADMVLDDTEPYEILESKIWNNWHFFENGNGINLSPQPNFYEPTSPIPWTLCYLRTASMQLHKEIKLTQEDFCVFPTLVNHRRWMKSCLVEINGKKQELPKTVIIAPEVESLEAWPEELLSSIYIWLENRNYRPLVVGCDKAIRWPVDMRCLTSVPVLARLIADARGFIGAHSFPWHLARHSETPAVCIQKWRDGLRRCLPIDTAYNWFEPEDWEKGVDKLLGAMK